MVKSPQRKNGEKIIMQIITYDQVKSKVIEVRDQKAILGSDVAELCPCILYPIGYNICV